MDKIISREWIPNDSKFYAVSDSFNSKVQEFSKEQLCVIIDYYKNKLVDAGVEPGQKIGIGFASTDISYTAIIFAAAELGLKLVVLNTLTSLRLIKSAKCSAHMPLDVFVYYQYRNTHLDQLLRNIKYYINNSKKVIQIDTNWSSESINSIPRIPLYAKPENDLLLCSSSGTTGAPKLIHHNQEYLYDLAKYNWEPLELNENDSVYHFSSLNHGASLSVFFLPAVNKCKKHYFDLPTELRSQIDHEKNFVFQACKLCNITVILSPNNNITDGIIEAIQDSEDGLPNTTIIVLTFINPRWLNVVKSGKLKKIISAFGCSEAGGPILLPYIDKNTDINSFDPKFLGKPLEGFFKTNVVDGMLTVNLPNGNTVETEDIIKETENGYYFVRKNKLKKINDIDINPLDIIGLLETYCSRSRFEIVIEEVYNKLYIVTDNQTMIDYEDDIKKIIKNFYDGEVNLTAVIFMPNFSDAIVSIKPDRDILLDYIRERDYFMGSVDGLPNIPRKAVETFFKTINEEIKKINK